MIARNSSQPAKPTAHRAPCHHGASPDWQNSSTWRMKTICREKNLGLVRRYVTGKHDTGPRNPNTSEIRYRPMWIDSLVRVNRQTARFREASAAPWRSTSSLHMCSNLRQHVESDKVALNFRLIPLSSVIAAVFNRNKRHVFRLEAWFVRLFQECSHPSVRKNGEEPCSLDRRQSFRSGYTRNNGKRMMIRYVIALRALLICLYLVSCFRTGLRALSDDSYRLNPLDGLYCCVCGRHSCLLHSGSASVWCKVPKSRSTCLKIKWNQQVFKQILIEKYPWMSCE